MRRISCLPCRGRKSKCDGSLPCSSCTLRGTSDTCSFPHSKRSDLTFSREEGSLKRRRADDDNGRMSRAGEGGLNAAKVHLGRALLALGETAGATLTISHHQYVRFDEVQDLFPSVNTCQDIFQYFDTEIFWHCTYIHRPALLSNWRRFAINGVSLPRIQVSLFCVVLAISLLQMPDSKIRSYLSLDRKASLHHQNYVQLAYAISLDGLGAFQIIDPHEDDNLFFAGMMVNYFVAVGSPELTWEALGKALRMARMMELFDTCKWPRGMSDLSRELRKRLAWELIYQDAFCCMQFTKKSEIIAEDISLTSPNFYTDDSFDIYSGTLIDATPKKNQIVADFHHGRSQLYEGVKKSSDFIRCYEEKSPAWLFREAWCIDEEMDDAEKNRFPSSLRKLKLEGTTRQDYIRCHVSMLGVMGSRRVRSSVLRMLLLNGSGDVLVEETALAHARKIIDLLPTLDQLASSPYVAYFSPFCSSMIFHAVCTFALRFLLQTSNKSKLKSNEHLNWLRDNISTVINALEKASERDVMALRCRQLLLGICNGNDQLQKCFNGKLMTHLASNKKPSQDGILPLDIRQAVDESTKSAGTMMSSSTGEVIMSADEWTDLLALVEADLDQFVHG